MKIQGERVFTERIRARWLKKLAEAQRAIEKRAARDQRELSKLTEALPRVKTTKQLQAWGERLIALGGRARWDLPELFDFRKRLGPIDVFYWDFRTKCTHCGRLSFGGTHGLPNAKDFYCYRAACGKAQDLAIERDKKLHPKRWKPKPRFDRVKRGPIKRKRVKHARGRR